MAKAPDLVCLGRISREMIYFPNEVKGPVLGAPSAYSSVAAACQGTRTGLVTKVGPAMLRSMLEPLFEAGVDTTGVCFGELTMTNELLYDAQGNKEIRYPSMTGPIRTDDVPEAYYGCQILYVSAMDKDVLVEDIPGVVALAQSSAVDLGAYGGGYT